MSTTRERGTKSLNWRNNGEEKRSEGEGQGRVDRSSGRKWEGRGATTARRSGGSLCASGLSWSILSRKPTFCSASAFTAKARFPLPYHSAIHTLSHTVTYVTSHPVLYAKRTQTQNDDHNHACRPEWTPKRLHTALCPPDTSQSRCHYDSCVRVASLGHGAWLDVNKERGPRN